VDPSSASSARAFENGQIEFHLNLRETRQAAANTSSSAGGKGPLVWPGFGTVVSQDLQELARAERKLNFRHAVRGEVAQAAWLTARQTVQTKQREEVRARLKAPSLPTA